MAIVSHEKRIKRMKQLHANVEAQIQMCDDQEEILLLAAIFLSCAKNMFLTKYPKEHARQALHQYIDSVLS